MRASMSKNRGRTLAAVLLAATIAPWPLASAFAVAAPFDGSWSVVVITDDGTCDRAYRYPVEVVNGTLRYHGNAGITISGKVDRSGKVKATIKRGDQTASGSGRLTQNAGTGTWTGNSRTTACSGRWKAERRG